MMLRNAVDIQRAGFCSRQQASRNLKDPVPPSIEQHISTLIRRSRVYQDSVGFCDGPSQMEATVSSYTDGPFRRRAVLSAMDNNRYYAADTLLLETVSRASILSLSYGRSMEHPIYIASLNGRISCLVEPTCRTMCIFPFQFKRP